MVYCFLGCTKVPRSNVGNGLWKSEESGCCPPTEPPLAAKGGAWFRSEILDTNLDSIIKFKQNVSDLKKSNRYCSLPLKWSSLNAKEHILSL